MGACDSPANRHASLATCFSPAPTPGAGVTIGCTSSRLRKESNGTRIKQRFAKARYRSRLWSWTTRTRHPSIISHIGPNSWKTSPAVEIGGCNLHKMPERVTLLHAARRKPRKPDLHLREDS